MKAQNIRKTIILLAMAAFLMLPHAPASARKDITAFQVDVIYVNGQDKAPANPAYDYPFVNALTGEAHHLPVEEVLPKAQGEDARILRLQGKVDLPAKNEDGTKAVYVFQSMENSYLSLDGLYYALSSSESEDPAAGLPYYQRVRIFSRQINPIVELYYEGEAPESLPLTLRLSSWAKNADYKASGFAKLDGQKQVNLFEVFSKAEDKARLRHFVLAELSWDKAAIAGSNSYTLEVGEIPGFSALVEGDAVSGFSVSLTKQP